MTLSFEAELWLHPGDDPWHFLTLPNELSDQIRARTSGDRKPFGSVRVNVTVGDQTWSTSLFPDKDSNAYQLPVKKSILKSAGLSAGDRVPVRLDIAR